MWLKNEKFRTVKFRTIYSHKKKIFLAEKFWQEEEEKSKLYILLMITLLVFNICI